MATFDYRPARALVLGGALDVGDVVYRGKVGLLSAGDVPPRWLELVAELAARGLTLREVGPFFWRTETQAPKQALEACPYCLDLAPDPAYPFCGRCRRCANRQVEAA